MISELPTAWIAVIAGFFTFNGVECKPLAIDGVMHIYRNHGNKDSNIHKTTEIGGYCGESPREPCEWESMLGTAQDIRMLMLISDITT